MACEGYEHGSIVVMSTFLPSVRIPVGTKGMVVKVRAHEHKIDVQFQDYGLREGLDAHAFEPMTGGEGQSGASGSAMG